MATQTITGLVAQRTRLVLEDRGLTQEWLSSASGISMRTLARRLHKTHPSGTTLEEAAIFARVLKVPLVSLLTSPERTESEVAA